MANFNLDVTLERHWKSSAKIPEDMAWKTGAEYRDGSFYLGMAQPIQVSYRREWSQIKIREKNWDWWIEF